MKPRLTQIQKKLLKDGAWSLSSSWILGAMRTDWKRIKGIKDPAPPDYQSTLKESLKKMDEHCK